MEFDTEDQVLSWVTLLWVTVFWAKILWVSIFYWLPSYHLLTFASLSYAILLPFRSKSLKLSEILGFENIWDLRFRPTWITKFCQNFLFFILRKSQEFSFHYVHPFKSTRRWKIWSNSFGLWLQYYKLHCYSELLSYTLLSYELISHDSLKP